VPSLELSTSDLLHAVRDTSVFDEVEVRETSVVNEVGSERHLNSG